MRGKVLNIIYLGYSVISLLILLGVLMGKLSFGLGLGDLGMLIISLVILILIGSFVFFKRRFTEKIKSWNWIISVVILLIVIYLILSLSLWRGVEYPWNGNLFLK